MTKEIHLPNFLENIISITFKVANVRTTNSSRSFWQLNHLSSERCNQPTFSVDNGMFHSISKLIRQLLSNFSRIFRRLTQCIIAISTNRYHMYSNTENHCPSIKLNSNVDWHFPIDSSNISHRTDYYADMEIIHLEGFNSTNYTPNVIHAIRLMNVS